MTKNRHTYKRPEAECCFGDAFVCCGGNEGFTQGSSWGLPAADGLEDLTVSSDIWEF